MNKAASSSSSLIRDELRTGRSYMCLIRLYAKQSQSKHKILREQIGGRAKESGYPQPVGICCVCMYQAVLFMSLLRTIGFSQRTETSLASLLHALL